MTERLTSQRVPRTALVVTVVHHPEDARIRHREIPALLDAGWDVTYAAPFTGYGLAVPDGGRVRCLDVPRAVGRRRLRAMRAARRLIAARRREHDVVLLHDPELLLAVAGLRRAKPVWDVHEDTAAALLAKEWLPRPLRALTAGVVRWLERRVENHMPLLLAEYQYQERFRHEHVVVPNAVHVPPATEPPGTDRVVYLGTVTMERGAAEMVDVGRRLRERDGGVSLEVIGQAHGTAARLLSEADRDGVLRWHGFVPNKAALPMVGGALAGLSLLQDLPNYRHSMPTKVLEYMAHGVPVITTPLPLAAELVEGAGAGVVVPFADPPAVVEAILTLRDDAEGRNAMAAAGRAATKKAYNWTRIAERFVSALDAAAR